MAIDLARWSVWRVLLVSLAWLITVPVCFVLYLVLPMYSQINASGSAGIGAVSVGVSEGLVGLWLAAPIVFVGTWGVLRTRRSRRPSS